MPSNKSAHNKEEDKQEESWRTLNIKQNCASLVLLNRLVRSMFTLAPLRLTCVLAFSWLETSFRYSTPRTRGD